LQRMKDLFVGENYLDCGEEEEYAPDPEVLALAFIMRCGYCVHSSISPTLRFLVLLARSFDFAQDGLFGAGAPQDDVNSGYGIDS